MMFWDTILAFATSAISAWESYELVKALNTKILSTLSGSTDGMGCDGKRGEMSGEVVRGMKFCLVGDNEVM